MIMRYLFLLTLLVFQIDLFGQSQFANFSTGQRTNGKVAFSQDGQFLGVLSGKNLLGIFKAQTQLLTNSITLSNFSETHELAFGAKDLCYVAGKNDDKYQIIESNLVTNATRVAHEGPDQITGIRVLA